LSSLSYAGVHPISSGAIVCPSHLCRNKVKLVEKKRKESIDELEGIDQPSLTVLPVVVVLASPLAVAPVRKRNVSSDGSINEVVLSRQTE
jgi:hypothetical protein